MCHPCRHRGNDPGQRLAVPLLFLLALSFFPFVARDLAEQGLGISYDAEGLDSLARHALRIAERGFSP